MRSIAMAITRGEGGGEPLPDTFPSLAALGVKFRRSELAVVAGKPGAGKSAFALVLALRAAVPTLYLSADSSAHTQAVRILAHLTGQEQHVCEGWLNHYPDWCAQQLQQADHIRWMFDSAPTLQDIEEEMDAYVTAHGHAPHLLVVDNLVDVVSGEGDGEIAGLRALNKDLKFFARHYNTCVLALHHVSESIDYKSEPCPPRAAIHGKVNQVPALILTQAAQDEGSSMWVAPVKNRSGKADHTGRTAVQLVWDAGSMTLNDPMSRR